MFRFLIQVADNNRLYNAEAAQPLTGFVSTALES